MSPHRIEMLPSRASLFRYGISQNGFLPDEAPLERLPQPYYQPWEHVIEQLPQLVEKQQLRKIVDALPVLHTAQLSSEGEWQRACSILALIAQGYIWSGPEPSQRLPPAITIPLLQASEYLEVPPVATYATLNLWNWRTIADGADITQPDSLTALQTATGTDDESWFLIISCAMEARAGPLIDRMLGAIEAVEFGDVPTVIRALEYFKKSMKDIGRLLERMDERCRPQVFYHTIRPFLAGSMNMEAAGLPDGVFYDEGNGKGSWRRYRGGSNGQSSLLQFLDAVLSVDHSRSEGFHSEMRRYMPGPHRRFLDDVETIANIRKFVASQKDNHPLTVAFNDAVRALGEFRDKHIALVTRYIVVPSRVPKSPNGIIRKDIASASTKMALEAQTKELRGTGGTKLIPFLQTSRNETNETTIERLNLPSRPPRYS